MRQFTVTVDAFSVSGQLHLDYNECEAYPASARGTDGRFVPLSCLSEESVWEAVLDMLAKERAEFRREDPVGYRKWERLCERMSAVD